MECYLLINRNVLWEHTTTWMSLKNVRLIEGSPARSLLIKCKFAEPEGRFVVKGMGVLINCKYTHRKFLGMMGTFSSCIIVIMSQLQM